MQAKRKKKPKGIAADALQKEIEQAIEKIVAKSSENDLLERIGAILTKRERQLLWAYLAETDIHEVAYEVGMNYQTAHNHLAIIEEKLGIGSRTELLKEVFSAILKNIEKS